MGANHPFLMSVYADLAARRIAYTVPRGYPFPREDGSFDSLRPDVQLSNGVLVKTAAWPGARLRARIVNAKRRYPRLDIRLVVPSLRAKFPLAEQGDITVAQWCQQQGVPVAEQAIPEEWLAP